MESAVNGELFKSHVLSLKSCDETSCARALRLILVELFIHLFFSRTNSQPGNKNLASTTHAGWVELGCASADIWSREGKVTACVCVLSLGAAGGERREAAFSAKLSHSEISISRSLAGLILPSEFVRCGSPRLNECARPSGRDRERERANFWLLALWVRARARESATHFRLCTFNRTARKSTRAISPPKRSRRCFWLWRFVESPHREPNRGSGIHFCARLHCLFEWSAPFIIALCDIMTLNRSVSLRELLMSHTLIH
jgi:hypothetical protein